MYTFLISLLCKTFFEKCSCVSNSQGRNLGRSVTPARTSGLSSIQGDLGESGLRYLKASLTNANDAQVTETFLTNVKRSIIES